MEDLQHATWICAEPFRELVPLNLFRKEHSADPMPEHLEALKNCHMFVRKVIQVPDTIEQARIAISADDYYKLYINGAFVGQGPAPGYHSHYFYNTYDVTDSLKPGENCIAVHVYYQGLVNRVWNSGDYRQGTIAELWLDRTLACSTDRSWKYVLPTGYRNGGIVGYDTQYLENIDMAAIPQGWKSPGFDDRNWKSAVEHTRDDHCLVEQPTLPVSVYEQQPQSIQEITRGHFLVDFGQEITGQFTLRATGSPGQVVEIRLGEELRSDEEHSVRYEMRCNCTYQEFWTLSGEEDRFEPFDYKAFRYAEILAPEGILEASSFLAIVRHYPMDDGACTLHTTNDSLNQIWSICKNGVRFGTQEIYTDCPSREKGQYLGDFTISGLSHLYLTGDLQMYKKALTDFALSASVCPGLMAVAPGSLMQEIADFSLQWPQNLLTCYRHSGDYEFLRDMYPVAENCVAYFQKYQRGDGLLESVKEKWNLVDWPENARDGYDFELSRPVKDGCHNVVNAFYIGAIDALNEIRTILGQVVDPRERERVVRSYHNLFYDDRTGLFVDAENSNHSSLHANILPLYFGLAPQPSHAGICQLIRNKGFACGVYMSYFLLKGLARIGEYALVYEMLVQDTERSWLNMVREGATTCFEAWGKDQKWNTSLCHPWASAPISVLIEDLVGVKPADPGWTKVSFRPGLTTQLDYLELTFPTACGTVQVLYQSGVWNITLPGNVSLSSDSIV